LEADAAGGVGGFLFFFVIGCFCCSLVVWWTGVCERASDGASATATGRFGGVRRI
jgi:hypothetical protein